MSPDKIRVAAVQIDSPFGLPKPSLLSDAEEVAWTIQSLLATKPKQGAIGPVRNILRKVEIQLRGVGQVAENVSGKLARLKVEAAVKFSVLSRAADIVIFPENSVPLQILPQIHDMCTKLSRSTRRAFIVVAGTHYCVGKFCQEVHRKLRARRLDGKTPNYNRQAHAPVFVREPGKKGQWYLIPKVAPSPLERKVGIDWPPSSAGWDLISFRGSSVGGPNLF